MTMLEKLRYLITEYRRGNYKTSDFCDLFSLYYRDLEVCSVPPATEQWLHDLDMLCGRFSEYPEDLAIPNAFVTAEEIQAHVRNFTQLDWET